MAEREKTGSIKGDNYMYNQGVMPGQTKVGGLSMRAVLSMLSGNFFGMSVLGLAVAVGGLAMGGGEPEAADEPGRAALLDDPGHRAACRACRREREAAEERARAGGAISVDAPVTSE